MSECKCYAQFPSSLERIFIVLKKPAVARREILTLAPEAQVPAGTQPRGLY